MDSHHRRLTSRVRGSASRSNMAEATSPAYSTCLIAVQHLLDRTDDPKNGLFAEQGQGVQPVLRLQGITHPGAVQRDAADRLLRWFGQQLVDVDRLVCAVETESLMQRAARNGLLLWERHQPRKRLPVAGRG